jgi:serine/threonine protein kinase
LKEIDMGDDDNPVSASGRSYDHEMQIMSVIPPHPHVVKLIDSFNLGSKFYIVVEYCDKGDLSDYLRRTSAPPLVLEIPELKIWKFIIQTLLALDHIHDQQIVHSDLKPSNIFLSGKDMNVKLADFGTS